MNPALCVDRAVFEIIYIYFLQFLLLKVSALQKILKWGEGWGRNIQQ